MRLAALSRYGVLDTPPEAAFDRIAQLASRFFRVPIALISLVARERQWFKACYGLEPRQTDRSISFCAHAIQTDTVTVVPDTTRDVRFRDNPLVTGAPGIRFYAGAPLITPDGFKLGTLCILDTEARPPLSLVQQETLESLASLVMDELELRRAGRELQASETRLRAIVESTSDAVYIKDTEGRYVLLNPAGARALGRDVGEVLGKGDETLFTAENRARIAQVDQQVMTSGEPLAYEEVASIGGDERVFLTSKYPYRSPQGELLGLIGVSRDVTESKRASEAFGRTYALLRASFDATVEGVLSVDERGWVTDFNQRYLDMWRVPEEVITSKDDDALVRHALAQLKDPDGFLERVQAAYANPEGETRDELELRDGRIVERASLPQRIGDRIVGRVWSFRDVTLWRRAEGRLQELNLALEARVAERTTALADANRELRRLNEQLRHDAFHDSLTGLPNRALFMDRLQMTIERFNRRLDFGFAVLFLDCDRFKTVNDSLGHTVGDAFLIALGERLSGCVRPGDTVARLGGDEFTILLEDTVRIEEAEEVAERIQRELATPFQVGAHTVHTTVSIGIVSSETGYNRPEDVLRDADIAMYRAKALGRAGYQLFTAELRERALSLITLENDLRSALARQELRVHYQPIAEVNTGRPIGFEALLRWQHPRLGMVSPVEFIPIAEETGLILELDRWALRTACEQVRVWRDRFRVPLALSVNLSGQTFMHDGLVDHVNESLIQTGFHAGELKLELTESVLMHPSQEVLTCLHALKGLGLQLYVDDFGTGYSSLAYLQRFPLDALKIDRAFIQKLTLSREGAELVRAILAMARSLKLQVVAEGVETAEQLRQLKKLRCTYAQGYLFAKPLDAEEAGRFLENRIGAP